jgi:N-acetylglucosamine-6-phosphate deacetylase
LTRRTLRAARLATPATVFAPGWLTVDDARIVALGEGAAPADGPVVELGDRLLAPGFVDLHVHGGGGAEATGETVDEVVEEVGRLARFHAQHGTTGLLPTVAAAGPGRLATTVRGIRLACARTPAGSASVLGSHLEGPWLAPVAAGAQDRTSFRRPEPAELAELLAAAEGSLRIVTLAPELPGAVELMATLRAAGVVASIGHTAADTETTRRALQAGARHLTHLFNAMPALHHREPGPVGVALTDHRLTVEVIADGQHVHPTVLGLVGRLLAGRLVAVTDAVAPVGLPPGRYHFGSTEVVVDLERVVLAEDPAVLAGSLLTMDRAVANLVASGLPWLEALAAASSLPARVAGAVGKGRLAAGADADLVVLEPDLRLAASVVLGRPVFDPAGLLEQLA